MLETTAKKWTTMPATTTIWPHDTTTKNLTKSKASAEVTMTMCSVSAAVLAVGLRLCAANALCDSKQIKIDAKNTVQRYTGSLMIGQEGMVTLGFHKQINFCP